MKSPVIMLALLLAAASAACRSSVDQQREIDTWRAVLDEDQPREVEPLTAGETLDLPRAFALATHFEEGLARKGEDYLQALIDRSRQASALYPAISLAPSAFVRQHAVGFSVPGNQERRFDVPLQAGYSNFQPWSQVASLDRATAGVEARRALLLDARATLLLEVAQAYFSVLRAERQSQVLESALSVQTERASDVEAQSQVGFARTLDVEQARAQAASTRVQLVETRRTALDARAALAYLVGAPTLEGPLSEELLVPDEDFQAQALLPDALVARQDLAGARAESAAALHGVDVAVGQYYPGVSLNLSYFLYRESVPDNSLWSALVTANLPIFSFGRIHADVRAAWSVFRQAKLTESQVSRRIEQQLATGCADLRASRERIEALAPQLAAAREAYQQSLDLARAGRATHLEELVAQDQLLAAELALADAGFARKLAWLALERARGTLQPGARGR
ncbi:MAG: TolC family protein [Planctomycetes bacterium]|nr:TolC family protein [Planctomycetota bacterium]